MPGDVAVVSTLGAMSADGWIGGWSPGIGDPSLAGWATVAAYFASAGLCWRARRVAIRERESGVRRGCREFWTVLTFGLVALGANKQLDLQSALTEFGRVVLQAGGWYEDRRTIQFGFIVVVLILSGVLCLRLASLVRQELRRVLPAVVGATGLCAFVAIRAASFHHVDRVLGATLGGARVNAILELGGVALIAIGALRYGRAPG